MPHVINRRIGAAILVSTVAGAATLLPSPQAVASHPGGCLTELAAVDVGIEANGMAVDPVTGDLYVVADSAVRVDVLDGDTLAPIDSITLPGTSISFVALDQAAGRMYVTSFSGDATYVVNLATEAVVATLATPNPYDVAIDLVHDRLYVAGQNSVVSVFDTATNLPAGTLAVGGDSIGIVVDSARNRVMVADFTNSTLDVFDATTRLLVDSHPLTGTQAVNVDLDPTTGHAWVATRIPGRVAEIDPVDGSTGTFRAVASAQGLALNPGLGQVYVTPDVGTTMSVVSMADGSLLDTFTVGTEPLVVEAGTNPPRVYAAGYGNGVVTAVGPSLLDPFTDVTGASPFCFDIEWLVGQAITSGFADDTFRSTSPVTRQSMAAFLYRYSGEPAFTPPVTPTFTDVPDTNPFYAEIEWMVAEGIAGGFADGGFHPGAPVSRQAMAAFFYGLAGEPAFAPPVIATFDDVPFSSPFYADIEWLNDTGITGGYADGGYHPGSAISRQAMAAFLHRYDGWAP